MEGLWVSLIAGAVGGILVTLGERFLFSAPEAWHGVKRSLRFYRQRWWERKGRHVTHCPECLRPHPDPVVDPDVLPQGWEDAPGDVHWLRCPDCHNVWGIRAVITKFMPVPTETAPPKSQS